jgi:methionine-rich copper-binding protein CopC
MNQIESPQRSFIQLENNKKKSRSQLKHRRQDKSNNHHQDIFYLMPTLYIVIKRCLVNNLTNVSFFFVNFTGHKTLGLHLFLKNKIFRFNCVLIEKLFLS